jgi:hypothetical protein
MRSSANGNPRFRRRDRWHDAAPQAGCRLAQPTHVGNRGMREGSTVSVELDGRGNIRIMRAAS